MRFGRAISTVFDVAMVVIICFPLLAEVGLLTVVVVFVVIIIVVIIIIIAIVAVDGQIVDG